MKYLLVFLIIIMNLALLLSEVLAVESGLVLYLPFDGNLKDASKEKNQCELRGRESYTKGKFGDAFDFDGATHIEVPDTKKGIFDGTSGLTIEVWVKQDTHHDNGIVVKLTSGNFWPCSYNLETWSDQLAYFDVGPDAGSYATAKYPLKEWYFLVGVFDGEKGEDRIYVNGKLENTNPRDIKVVPDGDLPVYIGCVAPAQYYFIGALDNLAIYNRALTIDEIRSDMNGTILSVDNSGKLSTTWAAIKYQNAK